ncbi:hypothetical protein GCM10018965_009150 [Nonomuraea roseola]
MRGEGGAHRPSSPTTLLSPHLLPKGTTTMRMRPPGRTGTQISPYRLSVSYDPPPIRQAVPRRRPADECAAA